jgi:hypothetical protein
MKRIGAVAAALVVLLAAGWSLFWWLGRDALVRAFDAEVARLEASGWTIGWAGREIGGFPFGYTMRLTDLVAAEPASGLAVRLPHASVENDGTDGVLVRLPDTFAADLPLPEGGAPGGAIGEAPTPAVLETAGEASGLVVRLAGAGTAERTVDVDADTLVWRMQLPGSGNEQALAFEALDAGMTMTGATGGTVGGIAGGAETVFRLQAARYGVDAAIAGTDGAEGQPSSMAASYADVTLTGRTTLRTPRALGEMLYAGAPGRLDLALQAGPAEAHLAEARGTLDWQGGSISAVMALESGRIDLQAETRQNVWTLTPEAPGTLAAGALGAGMVQASYAMPMAPAPEPDHMAIRVALLDVTLGEAAWQAIDPAGALPRTPAELVVDVSGLARVTRRIDEMSAGDPPPFELRELEVSEAAVDALGASLRASGSVEFLQPIDVPLGTVQVGMTGVAALIDALAQAGVLTPDMADMADAMLTVYARPAEGGDAWTTEITLTEEGALVNGLPVR